MKIAVWCGLCPVDYTRFATKEVHPPYRIRAGFNARLHDRGCDLCKKTTHEHGVHLARYLRCLPLPDLDVSPDEIRRRWSEGQSASQIRTATRASYATILAALDFPDWEAYNAARKAQRRALRDKTGFPQARKAALVRDGRRCVVTGAGSPLEVHHIDGNPSNNDLANLVTLAKEVHASITHVTLRSPRSAASERKHDRRRRMATGFIAHLHLHGYPTASLSACGDHFHVVAGLYNPSIPPPLPSTEGMSRAARRAAEREAVRTNGGSLDPFLAYRPIAERAAKDATLALSEERTRPKRQRLIA